MAGSSASLPCPLASLVPGDKVRLVLWFKGSQEKPVYTLDARGNNNSIMLSISSSVSSEVSLEDGRHWSDDKILEGRAYFRTSLSPGRLLLDTVRLSDGGDYICRVDFKLQPTTITMVNLTVNSRKHSLNISDI